MGSGIIVSETEPEMVNRYTWCKPCADGSIEYYEPTDGSWTKVRTIPAPAQLADITAAIAAHIATENAHHVLGLTGQRTVGGYKFTFTKGILTGFEQV